MFNYILVGDIGGTNARLAICNVENGNIYNIHTYVGNDYHSIEWVINHYLHHYKIIIKKACIAIACPIIDDWVEMTNHSWSFSIQKIKKYFNFDQLEVINDFTAMSMAIPVLNKKYFIQCGGDNPVIGKPIVVYGAGTGLGVSYLINVKKHWISLTGEGGHVDFAPNNEEEDKILSILRKELGHVSVEKVLSGQGLINIYRSIVKIYGRLPKENLLPEHITELALKNSCIYSYRALSIFCILMGRFGGNLALNMGTLGGVYISGGIITNFIDFFLFSGFRTAFEDKGRFSNYLVKIPVYLINHKQPGLLGAGAYIRQLMGKKLPFYIN